MPFLGISLFKLGNHHLHDYKDYLIFREYPSTQGEYHEKRRKKWRKGKNWNYNRLCWYFFTLFLKRMVSITSAKDAMMMITTSTIKPPLA